MFLKDTTRFKDGKEHHYWSLVENRRVDGGRKVVQRHVLYLGEINSSQQAAWRKTIEIFESGSNRVESGSEQLILSHFLSELCCGGGLAIQQMAQVAR